ncbi:MAG: DUF309 domain-containing protein [Elusimicrobia bacterium]|nr:DUF309 domain-containing protein [Elusimicrobiota bacterium]
MDPRHREAVARFNRGDYFEAHDAWEEIWNEAPEAERGFYQGLIQVTTALHHMTLGNMRGAKLLHGSAHELLSPYGDFHGGGSQNPARPVRRRPGRNPQTTVGVPGRSRPAGSF